jgi:hypothetical protein
MAVAMEVVEPLVEPELEGGLLRKKLKVKRHFTTHT